MFTKTLFKKIRIAIKLIQMDLSYSMESESEWNEFDTNILRPIMQTISFDFDFPQQFSQSTNAIMPSKHIL